MGKGGVRPGAGRPTKADELKIVNTAVEAIQERHGSLKDGFKWLLQSNEPSLIKFVWEHAVGKPREKVELSGNAENPIQLLFIEAKGCEPLNDTTKD